MGKNPEGCSGPPSPEEKDALSHYLQIPVEPLVIDPKADVAGILEAMGRTAFQARNLAKAVEVWKRMLKEPTTILFGLAGAMVPAGMRKILVYLIENRLIDCLVSTGANLFHDVHETMGELHWQGSASCDDRKLRRAKVDRIYDVFVGDKIMEEADWFIADVAAALNSKVPLTTREFLQYLGEALDKDKATDGILTSAARKGVPIYCPAIGDSSIGIALAVRSPASYLIFDTVRDVEETTRIVHEAEQSGVIYIGGGTPKNYIQQTEVTAELMFKTPTLGHRYAIQVTTDAPHWGGLSGCTFEEAQSWGKVAEESESVTVHCDATIALPLIVTALSQRAGDLIKKRTLPKLPVG